MAIDGREYVIREALASWANQLRSWLLSRGMSKVDIRVEAMQRNDLRNTREIVAIVSYTDQ